MVIINPNNGDDFAFAKLGNNGDAKQVTEGEKSIFAKFYDDNNMIEETDVIYINKDIKSDAISNWFKTHTGQWTEALKKEIQDLISKFNANTEYIEALKQPWVEYKLNKPLKKEPKEQPKPVVMIDEPLIENTQLSSEGEDVKNAQTVGNVNDSGKETKQKTNLREAILNLKPGEHLVYDLPSGSQKEVRRLKDGTIAIYTPVATRKSAVYDIKLATVYDSKYEHKVYEQFYSNTGLYTRYYDENGDATSVVSNIDMDTEGLNGARLINGPSRDLRDRYLNRNYSNQRFLDADGKDIITCRDGQYYNSKGKVITKEQAIKLLDKAILNKNVSKIIQEY